MTDKSKHLTLIGAGLVGSLLAIVLARHGYKIKLLEKRPDMRKLIVDRGRSINLAISTRGIKALDIIGLKDTILAKAIAMYGRAIHNMDGNVTFQPYGINNNYYINSISRSALNIDLLNECSKYNDIEILFGQNVVEVDFDNSKIITDNKDQYSFNTLIGCDGSASVIRSFYKFKPGFKQSIDELDYGYKEFTIRPNPDGSFKMAENALHIWPRGNFMLIALPNLEASFTVTLFLPYIGDISFAKLKTKPDIEAFFKTYFKDTIDLIDDYADNFLNSPTGHMVTVKSDPWSIGDKALLIGDAAHGIIPFYGQGMNCGFEDVSVLDSLLGSNNDTLSNLDLTSLFAEFFAKRKPNCDAISDMAYENFIEMRDKVGDTKFLFFKKIEAVLEHKFKGEYFSRYTLVSFSNLPYNFAKLMGEVNYEILNELAQNISDHNEIDFDLASELIKSKTKPLINKYASELKDLINDDPYKQNK